MLRAGRDTGYSPQKATLRRRYVSLRHPRSRSQEVSAFHAAAATSHYHETRIPQALSMDLLPVPCEIYYLMSRRCSVSHQTKDNRRKVLVARQGGACALCHKALHWKAASLDHIIPQSRGGTWEEWNLRATHAKCNSARGAAWEDSVAMRAAQICHQLGGYGFLGNVEREPMVLTTPHGLNPPTTALSASPQRPASSTPEGL